jgi:hypothetical protein
MKFRLSSRVVAALMMGILAFALMVPISVSFAQDIGAQASIPGSIQQGSWFEQWNQPGTAYCPNNQQRFITSSNEPFTLSVPAGEGFINVAYATSRLNITLARTTVGNYVYTNQTNQWVHLIEANRVSPTQMSIVSTFYARDGSCTLVNNATWSFSQQSPPPAPTGCIISPTTSAVNKRSGPGVNFGIVGRLFAGNTATAVSAAFDASGTKWWQLSDNTWVSGAFTSAQGTCP